MRSCINWKSIVQALQAKGLSQKRIAEQVGVDQSTICRIAEGLGPEPRYSIAVALLELAEEDRGGAHHEGEGAHA